MDVFVGRREEESALKAVFEGPARKGLVIQSIEGPSGIGKSSVLAKALQSFDLASRGFLKLELAGSDRGLEGGNSSAFAGVDQLVSALVRSAIGPDIELKPPGYYFSKTRDTVAAIAALRSDIKKELAEQGVDPEDAKAVARVLKTSAALLDRVSRFIPKVREFVNPDAIDMAADHVEPTVADVKSLSASSVRIWERLGIGSRTTLREAVKEDADEALAAALMADLQAILLGEHDGKLQPGHGRIKRLERLLLVFEDYEALVAQLGGFLVPKLVSKLKASEIETTLIVLSRFRLRATNPLWKDYAAQLKQPIVLKPLTKPEIAELLAGFNVFDECECERAWRETAGLPYHLSLLIDEIESGGRSSTTLKELYDRTTMWMTAKEKDWLSHMVYLDRVQIDTLTHMLGSHEEGEAAFNWFESEGSILDQAAGQPKMLPFVQSRLREYVEGRGDPRLREIRQRAEEVNAP